IRDTVDFAITRHDLRALPVPEREAQARRLAAEHAATGFNLAHDLMLRVDHVAMEDDEAVMLFNLHHIASDGWSMDLLIREFIQRYEADDDGRLPNEQPLPLHYADFAGWQREWLQGAPMEQQFAYWQRQLADLPSVHSLPLDHPRPAVAGTRGARHYFSVPAELQAGIAQLARAHQATVFMVLHGALCVLLSRCSGSEDIVIGTPVANRLQRELEDLIGCFANTLVLRTSTAGNPGFVELLDRVKAVNLGAQAHQDMPFDHLVERLNPVRSTQYSPVFQVLFSMGVINVEGPVNLALDDASFEVLPETDLTAKYELTFDASETRDGLAFHIEYNRDLWEPGTMARLAAQYVALLQSIVATPQASISTLALLDAPQRRAAVQALCGEVQPVPAQSLAALLQAGSARAPDALAVVGEDEQLTHAELQRRAGQLAHWLRGQGLQPDERVGLC
ncbi:MAG: AMP-binding protein, partial [Pelomonas sp.]|nr:AMP-binding protein [Roseateles sp.]